MPHFLQQSGRDITAKFHNIKLLEDQRVHDALVNKESSKWSMIVGQRASKINRNRYSNVFPFDNNRVKLALAPGSTKSDYINASHITVDLNDTPRQYIAAQGPEEQTASHFWQMVLQQTAEGSEVAIAMVTPLAENGIDKCFKYWPDTLSQVVELSTEPDDFEHDLRIECLGCHELGDIEGTFYTMLKLDALDPETKEVVSTRNVHHIYYTKWVDMKRPSVWNSIHSLSDLLGNLNGSENPLIVHCSAGVGRSGTFITLDYLFHNEKLLLKPDGTHDLIEDIVSQLRKQRIMMVQSLDQFKFCYEALAAFFRDLTRNTPFPA